MKRLPTPTRIRHPDAPDLLTQRRLKGASAPASATAEIVIQAPMERIWTLITDVQGWPLWNPAIQSVRLHGPFQPDAEFVWTSQGFTVRSKLQDVQALRSLSWTGRAFGTRALHTWHLRQTQDGVRVRTDERFDGWLPWLFKGAMQRKLDQALPQWLTALKRASEQGRSHRSHEDTRCP